jgi:hypothetical protein
VPAVELVAEDEAEGFHGFAFSVLVDFVLLHRSLQYRTSSQLRSHFLRQEKERLQTGQVLVGKWAFDFIIPFFGVAYLANHKPDAPFYV